MRLLCFVVLLVVVSATATNAVEPLNVHDFERSLEDDSVTQNCLEEKSAACLPLDGSNTCVTDADTNCYVHHPYAGSDQNNAIQMPSSTDWCLNLCASIARCDWISYRTADDNWCVLYSGESCPGTGASDLGWKSFRSSPCPTVSPTNSASLCDHVHAGTKVSSVILEIPHNAGGFFQSTVRISSIDAFTTDGTNVLAGFMVSAIDL
jgi:hypothetical protein